MTDKATVWTEVKAAYPAEMLAPLTNLYDRSSGSTTVDDTVGQAAAQQFIDLFPDYAEVEFDASNRKHLARAIPGTVAILYQRDGLRTEEAKRAFDHVFGESGTMNALKRTGARARVEPKTTAPDTLASGQERRAWSHEKSLPTGFMPTGRGVNLSED